MKTPDFIGLLRFSKSDRVPCFPKETKIMIQYAMLDRVISVQREASDLV